jgi:hypothetical protein
MQQIFAATEYLSDGIEYRTLINRCRRTAREDCIQADTAGDRFAGELQN